MYSLFPTTLGNLTVIIIFIHNKIFSFIKAFKFATMQCRALLFMLAHKQCTLGTTTVVIYSLDVAIIQGSIKNCARVIEAIRRDAAITARFHFKRAIN